MSEEYVPSIGRRNSIPVLYTQGTFYEVGFDVGRTFRGLIEDFLNSYGTLREVLLPSLETPEGKAAYDSTLASLETNFPHYVRELRGTADGARVPFVHLMLLHMDMIVPKSAGDTFNSSSYGCTSVCCTNESQAVLGHTEDAEKEILNHVYIVHAHITEKIPQGRWKSQEERFAALCYAGHLPGFCMGYNCHGLVYSVNVVFAKYVPSGRTPRHFLTRALLAAENMEAALNILKDPGVGIADGVSINLSFTRQDGDILFHNVEVGPSRKGEESEISVLTVRPGEHNVHTNKFLRLEIPEDTEVAGRSSEHRHRTAVHYHQLDSRESVLSFVSDTSDKDFPIFREGGKKDPIVTVVVGLFDLWKNNWSIWMRKPLSIEPLLTLPLI